MAVQGVQAVAVAAGTIGDSVTMVASVEDVYGPRLDPPTIVAGREPAVPSFISQYLDTGLTIKDGETKRGYEREERERLTLLVAITQMVSTIPRRLGPDVDGSELAADKKRSKRVSHALSQSLKAWGGPVTLPGKKDNISRAAAQMDWKKFLEEQRVYINNRMRYIVTWQHKHDGDLQWTKSTVVRFQNEIKWLDHALRSTDKPPKDEE